MGHIVCSQMRRHLSSHSVISPHQHVFLRGLSCETQLISVVHEWAGTLNAHGQADVDLRLTLKQGVRFGSPRVAAAQGTPLRLLRENWLRSFLTNRRQRVIVNGSSSSWPPVLSGVQHCCCYSRTTSQTE